MNSGGVASLPVHTQIFWTRLAPATVEDNVIPLLTLWDAETTLFRTRLNCASN